MTHTRLYPAGVSGHSTSWSFSGNSTMLNCGCGWDSGWTTSEEAARRWAKHIRDLAKPVRRKERVMAALRKLEEEQDDQSQARGIQRAMDAVEEVWG